MTKISINPERLWSRLMDMSEIGEIPNNGSRRLALSQDDVDGRELLLAWCDSRGCRATFDKIGNLFIRRDGTDPDALSLAIGSHLDTQPNGGRFDGILGVLAGLEVLETLDDFKIRTRAPIDLVVWTNEEGARFQPAMMGSGVYCGVLDLPSVLATTDDQGVSVAEETAHHGYDKGCPPGFQQFERYVELHIEQGPILEMEDKAIGVVTGGQGIRWYDVTLTGEETHAGPVPMRSRRDPVPALAHVVELVYRIGQKDENARATIGKIETRPGSINVVPGQVCLSVDLRHPKEADLVAMQEAFLNGICNIASEHPKLEVKAKCRWHSPVVQFDPEMVSRVREAANQRNLPSMEIVSGAGHDAFNLAQVVPTTMIFVPCRDGISHNELEYTKPEHAAAGANVLLDLALRFAKANQDALQLQE
ncbi:M20 family metallo-hydrolase [Ruegeria atlantica]|uniref:M20 family metallo-hydrolase n=1 Tax=Ruegeria atlantica TaxID=81569 RepID=UPI001C2BB410|nr:M20 family metallo-hydrolase [Ruegeria atlantica]